MTRFKLGWMVCHSHVRQHTTPLVTMRRTKVGEKAFITLKKTGGRIQNVPAGISTDTIGLKIKNK